MILKNGKIVLEDRIIENGYIVIHNKKITDVVIGTTDEEGIDLKGNWVLPGFIECHVHGGYGVDFESGPKNRFEIFAHGVASEGVTRYAQGPITNSVEDNDRYFTEFGDFMKNHNNGTQGSIAIGAHMEGPFISPKRKGAHDENLLILPSIELTDRWNKLSNGGIAVVTYAGEEQDGSYTKWLIENNILPSIGHTDMEAHEFDKDYKLGVAHVTHLFNAMSGVDHKRPGLATAALNYKDVLCEVVSDGIHIQKEVLQMIYDHKGPEGICIVTDAMNAKGLPDGEYKLGSLPVTKVGMKVVLKGTNTLAAAASTYDHNVRTYKNTCSIPMMDLIKMTSINIAKQLNLFDITGSIEPNKFADLVVLDKDLNVMNTIVEGNMVFKK